MGAESSQPQVPGAARRGAGEPGGAADLLGGQHHVPAPEFVRV